jgi:hypothetical protein
LFDGSQISPACPSDNSSIHLKSGMERWWKIEKLKKRGKNELLGEKPVPIPLYPPQILQGLAWDRTRASAVQAECFSK